MKIKFPDRSKVPALLTVGIVAASFGLLAWAGNPQEHTGTRNLNQDTVPTGKTKTEKDFDKELRQLDEAQKQLLKLQSKDWDQFQADLQKSLSKINTEQIQLETHEALKNIDMAKIGKDIEEALSKIDFTRIEKDLDVAMENFPAIDKEKMGSEMEKARKEINEQLQRKEWQKEIDDVKKIDLQKIQEEMENVKKELEQVKDELKVEKLDLKKLMSESTGGIDQARAELKGYQEMVYAMEKDGLLNTTKDYSIRYDGESININDNRQPVDVFNRYKKYFRKESVTIKKEGGKLSIDND